MNIEKRVKSKKNTRTDRHSSKEKPRSLLIPFFIVLGLLVIIRPFLYPQIPGVAVAEAHIPPPEPIRKPIVEEKISVSNDDLTCLSKNVFYEARGTSENEKIRVINVTLNRLKSGKYPNTVCEVVHQYKQFSWTLEQSKVKTPVELLYGWSEVELREWDNIKLLSKKALSGELSDITGGAMYYHTHSVNPTWASKKENIIVSKWHRFYR